MSVHYADDRVTIHHGDCLEVLRELPDASVDAVVTDPPYGLANTDSAHVAETITRWVNGERDYLPGGAGFMGKAWDAFVPPVAVWDECMRVLKPGGHLLAFAGSRTVDLMTLGIRLAGFEVRDSIAWLHSQGFPKSLDVSKAIDKRPGVTRHAEFARHLTEKREAAGLTRADVSEAVVGTRTGACWNWEHHQFPEAKWWPALRDLLDLDDDTWGPVIAEAERQKIGTRAGNRLAVAPGQGEDRSAIDLDVTAPATPDAERWQGWGTALKPAFEPIVVARKPLAGTVAANVLAHGTGALNIDACRVAAKPGDEATGGVAGGSFLLGGCSTPQELRALAEAGAKTPTGRDAAATYARYLARPKSWQAPPAGRWPTNVVLDDSQAAELDRQSGESTGKVGMTQHGSGTNNVYGKFERTDQSTVNDGVTDRGGASRFFPTFRYEAKAPKSERPKVNGVAHPTVKPLDLMRWLVRLVTPPGGTVLEPFAGSGTTVEACLAEGFCCIAIERETDYLPLIMQRVNRRRDPVSYIKTAGDDLGLFDLEGEGGGTTSSPRPHLDRV